MYKCVASAFVVNRVFTPVITSIRSQRESRIITSFRTYKKPTHKKLYELLQNMPKKVDVKELQGIRLARKEKVRRYPPSTVYLQVLGSGAPGAPKSLYVFTEQARFLFNCGEGSQRLAYEHKVKLGMMEHVLITHKSWNNVGGLPGVLLTLQDTGVPEITLHGPPGIESLYFDTRHFIRFRDLDIKYRHYLENEGIIGDKNDPLTIQAVPIWAKEDCEVSSIERNGREMLDENQMEVEDLYAHEKTGFKRRPRPGRDQFANPEVRKKKTEESIKCKNLAIAYICRPPPKAGALLLEKCLKAGVPPGPLLGELKRGQDVVLPNGNTVLASDVTSPDDPGPVFIVIEVPTIAYLDSLLESPAFGKYQASAASDADVAEVVIHFTSPDVISNPRYQEWMSRFSPSTNHLCLNESSTCMGSIAVHRIQYKLNLLSSSLFPILEDKGILLEKDIDKKAFNNGGHDNAENAVNTSESSNSTTNLTHTVGPTYQATTLMTYYIRPKKKFNRFNELMLTPDKYLEECYAVEGFESILQETKSKLSSSKSGLQFTESLSESFPSVTFLGTGSCIPNKTRNTSGILLRISTNTSLLMDCGEGTYGQLVRLMGMTKSDEVLRQLSGVYISHLHADHHIGFIRVLMERRRAFHRAGILNVPKLQLLAPQNIISYLASYHTNFEPILQDFTLVGNQRFLSQDFRGGNENYDSICSALEMRAIDMTYVIHCPSSFGVAWTHKDGWKIAYSGDTMPCEDFVRIGQNCDLLIHEATMEDELEEDARVKTHSTTSQAIQVGRDMRAHYIMLTHFSQRYAKVPLLEGDMPENVGIAFDNMQVCLEDLPSMHHMYKALVTMFAEDYEDMLEKTAKKRTAREIMNRQLKELINKNSVMENALKKSKTDAV
ncbi:Zinc phosphodiesterase ELAC protein 2 [Halocaridina rubra]|uniref:Zinc phosphodiesterase ELAC protein 2 n=1 Tax=Halocaridina rubra TaxID=373956 RepID=A0AAN8ZS56_HALRR